MFTKAKQVVFNTDEFVSKTQNYVLQGVHFL